MSDEPKTPKKIVQDFVRDESNKDVLAAELVNTSPASPNSSLTPIQIYDIKEIIAYGLVNNLRRSQCVDLCIEFLEQQDVIAGDDVSMSRLYQIYVDVRGKLLHRTMENIESEKENFYKNMSRLALKCEANNDYGNAIKAYREIAELAGVFKEKDDSRIVLNFIEAKKQVK